MKNTIRQASILLAVIACLACVSCTNAVTIRNTSATAIKPATETIVVATAVAAKQEVAGMEITTKQGAHITIVGLKQDADDVVKAGVNWWGLNKITGLFYGHETAKVTQAATTERAGIAADVAKKEVGAGVVNTANTLNNAHGIPAYVPEVLP